MAVARWCSGNHTAASLAGEKMTKVWATAQRPCPPMKKANGACIPIAVLGRARSTLPAKFSHAPRTVCRDKVRGTARPACTPSWHQNPPCTEMTARRPWSGRRR